MVVILAKQCRRKHVAYEMSEPTHTQRLEEVKATIVLDTSVSDDAHIGFDPSDSLLDASLKGDQRLGRGRW